MNKAENSTSAKNLKHSNSKKHDSVAKVEQNLGYSFINKDLITSALAHPSYLRENETGLPFEIHYQRLEFLGDSVLGCIIAHNLFSIYPKKMEGFLSKAYSVLSRGSALVKIAKKLNIGHYLNLRGHKEHIPDSILEDTVEAIIGAMFLDAGYDKTSECVMKLIDKPKAHIKYMLQKDNPKGQLQEQLADKAKLLEYKLISFSKNKQQNLNFQVELYLDSQLLATGSGNTKKKAEEKAAKLAIKKISQ